MPEALPLPTAKPLYLSKGVIGGAVAVAAAGAQLAGVDTTVIAPLLDLVGLDPSSVTPAAVLSSLGVSGGVLAIIGRVYATATLTARALRRPSTALSMLAGPALAGAVILGAVGPLGACATGVVMPGPVADITARSALHQVASGRANLNAVLAAAVYVQSGQATGHLTDTVRELSASAAAAIDRADAVATAGASQTVVTVFLSAAHRDLRELAAAMAKEVRGSVLALIATASVERGLDLGSNLAIGATAAAHTRLTAWESEARDPTAAESAALAAETGSLLAIIRGE